MTKKEAQDYLKRWRLVNQVLDEELRQTSIETKFEKMDAAYRMAIGLGFLPKIKALKRETEDEVRQRWLRLQTTQP
jgi:Trp operon repressor